MSAAPRITALASAADAAPIGLALIAGLLRERRAPVGAVVLVSPSATPSRAPRGSIATHGGARTLARSLQARGLSAAAVGRLAVVEVHGDPGRTVCAVDAACGEAPVVTVLAGPRTEEVEAVLAGQDAIVVALDVDAPAALATLVTGGDRVHVAPVAVTPAGRALARVGLSSLPALRRLGRRLAG